MARRLLNYLLPFCVVAFACAEGPVLPYRPPIPRPESLEIGTWDEPRWVEYLSNQTDFETGRCQPAGLMIDLLDLGKKRSGLAWDRDEKSGFAFDVAYADQRERCLYVALLHAATTGHDPGMWLLTREDDTTAYTEAKLVVDYLQLHGVPLQLQTLPIPEKSWRFGHGETE